MSCCAESLRVGNKWWKVLMVLGGVGGLMWAAQPAAGDDDFKVVRVEEDWELVVSAPDLEHAGPQITCVISPTAQLDGVYSVLEINQQTLPEYAPGGLQLQLWEGETPLSDGHFPNCALLAYPGETITWTQCMQLRDGLLQFEVLNGRSLSWGDFGGQGYLKTTVQSSLEDLNAYQPQVSVANSGVPYGGNRVESLVLKRVRYYTADGRVFEDSTPRVVVSQP